MAIISNKDDIKDGYETAKRHFKVYFDPLTEFERLARNKPHDNVVRAKLPTVTDGNAVAGFAQSPRYFCAKANPSFGAMSPPRTKILRVS